MKYRILTFLCAIAIAVTACEPPYILPSDPEKPENGNNNSEPEPEPDPEPDPAPGPAVISDEGLEYVWDESVIPEIRISISLDQWNALLKRFDENPNNVDYFHCDITYTKGSEVTSIEDAGIRLRGNTSRRRPEGSSGQPHVKDGADWHHCHFGINFRKYNKDKAHTVKGIRKVNLKWFKDDPCYVRELYCYDLFRRYGIWTAAFDVYCRVWVHVEGDSQPAYFGVYEMIEPIDDKFIQKRVDGMFGSEEGNLWKCGWSWAGAYLDNQNAHFGLDEDTGENMTYEYKGEAENYETAKAQLQDFIAKLTGKSDESFTKWIKEVCDVEFLLKTYAVNVAVGMWDDHWNNGNNFYLYFNSMDKYDYKVFLIPYDYDNTLGTSANCGIISDSGRQDPYNWGDGGRLMERLMKIDEFKAIYRDALKEIAARENNLFHKDASMARIKAWQDRISPYVGNDTGEDMKIEDKPASWGNHGEYRIMTDGPDNFFEVKTSVINGMK